MLRVRCPGPVNRRDFLRLGFLALGGVTLADVLRARAEEGSESKDTSVILLYLHGGPSQLETYDLKPNAPTEYRSVFKPIATKVPGLQLCELFPLQAGIADRISLIRSVHHTMNSHTDGGIEMLTGKTPTRPDPTSTSISEHPDFGAVASRLLPPDPGGLPHYVALPRKLYMTQPSYLGVQHGAFQVGDPSLAGFAPPSVKLAGGVNAQRLEDRRGLRDAFDGFRAGQDQMGAVEGSDKFRDIAFRMVTNNTTAQAFDLNRESDRLRDRYGRHLWGQSCLLARRLAEFGTAVISLYIDTPKVGPEFTNWDDHIMNANRPGHFAKFMETRLPYMDQALSALIEDIYARGLDRKILVLVLGEFGRTPRLSSNGNGTGRDHWPDACSVLVSGGGFPMGQVIGATNSKAEYPAEKPYTPKDVLATVYHHLGIDRHHSFTDLTGRPIPILNEGRPIPELVG